MEEGERDCEETKKSEVIVMKKGKGLIDKTRVKRRVNTRGKRRGIDEGEKKGRVKWNGKLS